MIAKVGWSIDVKIPDASSAKRFGRFDLLDQAYQQATK